VNLSEYRLRRNKTSDRRIPSIEPHQPRTGASLRLGNRVVKGMKDTVSRVAQRRRNKNEAQGARAKGIVRERGIGDIKPVY